MLTKTKRMEIMVNTKNNSNKFVLFCIVAAVVVAVALIGVFTIRYVKNHRNVGTEAAISAVTTDATTAGELRIAVINMNDILDDARALKALREQKESYDKKLKAELESRQKALEKEKKEIEKSQDVLSHEALQRRVVEYQNKIARLQRDVTERAQSIDTSFQKALMNVQEKHLTPIIDAIIAKKNLSLVIDGRYARTGKNVKNLDITKDVIDALNKKLPSVSMEKPKGF